MIRIWGKKNRGIEERHDASKQKRIQPILENRLGTDDGRNTQWTTWVWSDIRSHRDLKSHRERKKEKKRDIKISLYFGLKTIRNFRFSAYCPNSLGPISTPLCVHFATRIHAKYKRNSCRAGGNNERKEYFLKCYPFVFLSRVVDKENRKGEDWT